MRPRTIHSSGEMHATNRTSDLQDRLGSHTTLAAPLLTFLAVCAMAPSQADEPPKPASRAEAIAIIADARKIVTPNGVERLEKVRIGGIDQWVSIRGTDRRNPVLLHIHGGPGYISIPMSWWFSRGWEEYFTIVQWDQRAAGKTHYRNVNSEVAAAWFDTVEAPEKHLVWFEHSALVRFARPIAEKAGSGEHLNTAW